MILFFIKKKLKNPSYLFLEHVTLKTHIFFYLASLLADVSTNCWMNGNSGYPGQTPLLSHLSWVRTVCTELCSNTQGKCVRLTSRLCFRHLSESRFLLDALHRRSKFANFCHDLMQNHLS